MGIVEINEHYQFLPNEILEKVAMKNEIIMDKLGLAQADVFEISICELIYNYMPEDSPREVLLKKIMAAEVERMKAEQLCKTLIKTLKDKDEAGAWKQELWKV